MKTYEILINWKSRKGNAYLEIEYFTAEAKALAYIERFKAEHTLAKIDNIALNAYPFAFNRFTHSVRWCYLSGAPLHYVKQGGCYRGHATPNKDQHACYKREAEKLGYKLANYGNDSKSGFGQYGEYCYVVGKDGQACKNGEKSH